MNHGEQWHAQGAAYQAQGEWERARECYERALAYAPHHPHAQFALAQLRMMLSHFRDGRAQYETRFAAREGEADWRGLPIARWHGEKLAGRRVLLWAEQGFGDVIMHAGFVPWLLAQGARVTLSVFPKMMPLLARAFPQARVESLLEIGDYALAPTLLALGTALPGALARDYARAQAHGTPDFAAPMGDLLVYGLPEFIPARHAPYLKADPRRLAEMRRWLETLGPGRRIGISWRSTGAHGETRSAALSQWVPLLSVPGCHFISLQHHAPAAELRHFRDESGYTVHAPPFDPTQDTDGLAALAACMNEVITIDNSNVHLAGALGVPTTLLLPRGCDFRWPVAESRPDTLWYGSVRVLRQERAGDWGPVLRRAAVRLARFHRLPVI